jgi:subfamily B ATP-binding cassette protein MsbA
VIIPVPLWEKEIIDEVIPASDLQRLIALVLRIAVFYSVYFVLNYIRNRLSSTTRERVLSQIRIDLYDKLQRMSLRFLGNNRSGELLSRIMHDVGFVQHLVNDRLFMTIGSAAKMAVLVFLMIRIHPQLSLLSLSLLPVVSVIVMIFRKRFYQSTLEHQQTQANLSAAIQDNISAMKLIQAENLEDAKQQQTARFAERLAGVNVHRAKIGITGNLIVSLLTYVPLLVLIWGFGGYQIIRSSLSVGSLLAFMQYVFALIAPISSFFTFVMNLQAGYAALDRVYEILESPEQVVDQPGAVPLKETIGSIRFEGVSFAFADDRPGKNRKVLENIDFRLTQGERVGIVGLTGAGKTSFVDLILRFHTPGAGTILLNGRALSDFTAGSIRSRIVYVPQADYFFHDTLRNNLTLGKEYPDERVYAVLSEVFGRDFLDSLPNGVDSIVGERGVTLSGGQRQQLALARALLRKADLYILDEAFSAFDSETEQTVKPYLRERTRGSMVVIIAHRFSILDTVDRVVVMAHGRIVERGTIVELLRERGLFYNLYDAQA